MSEEIGISSSLSEQERYRELISRSVHLFRKEDNLLSSLSNCTSVVKTLFPKISWCGFYINDGEKLVLGPFQGSLACTEIPFGKGVCGTAYHTRTTQIVPDVHKYPGHIACSSLTNSEIVVPFFVGSVCFGVLDLDSYEFNAFNHEDAFYLEKFLQYFATEVITNSRKDIFLTRK